MVGAKKYKAMGMKGAKPKPKTKSKKGKKK